MDYQRETNLDDIAEERISQQESQPVPPDMRLTRHQLAVLLLITAPDIFDDIAPGPTKWTIYDIGKGLGFDKRYTDNYLRPRLVAMRSRGFLESVKHGGKLRWFAGPMVDKLKELGFYGFTCE